MKGEKIEGSIPGIDININEPKIYLKKTIIKNNPNTLKGIFNDNVDDNIYLNKTNIKLPECFELIYEKGIELCFALDPPLSTQKLYDKISFKLQIKIIF